MYFKGRCIQIIWFERPCWDRACHNAGQLTRSNALDKSKANNPNWNIGTEQFVQQHLRCHQMFLNTPATSKAMIVVPQAGWIPAVLLFVLESCMHSVWKIHRMLAMGRYSEGTLERRCFGNILKSALNMWYFPARHQIIETVR